MTSATLSWSDRRKRSRPSSPHAAIWREGCRSLSLSPPFQVKIVCRIVRTITVDGVTMGLALDRDRFGWSLPVSEGCRCVADEEVFLMNWQSENSRDGRYFGPLSASTMVGRANPVWILEAH
jgi:hypothetical protein